MPIHCPNCSSKKTSGYPRYRLTGCDCFDMARVETLVKSCWAKLPAWAWRGLTRWWTRQLASSLRPTSIGVYHGWTVEDEGDAGFERTDGLVPLGLCSQSGTVKLLGDFVDRSPNEVVIALIGHELAHVFAVTNPVWLSGTGRSVGDFEADARELAFGWSADFDTAIIDRWCEAEAERVQAELGGAGHFLALRNPQRVHDISISTNSG